MEKKTTIQTCASVASCSMDHLYVETQPNDKISGVKHCCVSQDNCNTVNLAQRVYAPLPFTLHSCLVNHGHSYDAKPIYSPCQTSCEASYNTLTKETSQKCSTPQTACTKDEITFDPNSSTLKFCCISSNNCNVVDLSQMNSVFAK